jgi:excisionase family DNA binding protein
MPEVEPLALSVKDTAKVLSISKSQVYVLLGDGTLTARKDGTRTLVDYATVKAHHESLPKFVPGVPIPNAPKAPRKATGARS